MTFRSDLEPSADEPCTRVPSYADVFLTSISAL